MRNKQLKRGFAVLLTWSLAITGCLFLSGTEAKAEDGVVVYQTVEYDTFKTCIEAKKAPQYDGESEKAYLFAGWYQSDKDTIIKELQDVEANASVSAKFVSAALSGVVCQEKAGFSSNNTKTNLRMISLVDSTNYKAVGFNVYGRYDDGSEWTQYQYTKEGNNKAQSTTVYSSLQKYKADETPDGDPVKPEAVFGEAAKGFKFTTANLTGIPKNFFDTILVIQPYWITMDGTYVEGMGEFDRANDSVKGIVNVSVNIKNAEKIAAGALDLQYNPSNYTYAGIDYGRVFEEMESSQTNGVVKCVGNVSDIAENASDPNDIYVNVRFTKTESGKKLEPGTTEFEVGETLNKFCDNKEKVQTISAWNVSY